ncbi:BCCT family transporter [Marinobacter xestospongiae]|uniref:BCCT family transporter n=1 Tax=Marinobacter xestospongiae TaxID=994319 RepID=UPI002006B1F6|nr:BCCT family transporter [Marinobacter xestospongiae]MCK7568578.1 BCCT family transporter [Marinobacter xestospongiae]
MSDKEQVILPEGRANRIDTDYELGQDNIESRIGPIFFDVHNRVFIVAGIIVLSIAFFAIAFQDAAEVIFVAMRDWLTVELSSFFIMVSNIFLVICVLVAFSRLGNVRLGGTDAKPDYGYLGWFSMLFAAGMGTSLIFFGVSEPLTHALDSYNGAVVGDNGVRTDWSPLAGTAGDQESAGSVGMAASAYHWALHAWGIYAFMALALALFAFNKGLPLTMRSMFYPILGERIWGWPGHVIDVMAIVATIFGIAPTLSFGSAQTASGLNYLFGLPDGDLAQIIIAILITGGALVSVLLGIKAGIKRLSEFNMILAAILLLIVVTVGPTLQILAGISDSFMAYLRYLPELSNPIGREDQNFAAGWSAFYWAWWVAWSPFVGMFIARISRGRTVREFMIAVLLLPSSVCILWFSVFGGLGLDMYFNESYNALKEADLPLKLFVMLDRLPLAEITSFITMMLIVIFFITSADSGALVLDSMAAGGKMDTPTPQKIFWCMSSGVVVVALILGGGMSALQAMTVSTGLPFAIVLLIACYSVIKGLRDEPISSTGNEKAEPAYLRNK